MSQTVDVATWVALIAGLAGIVLSVVAIWFAFAVDSRSRRVTEQMLQSLQKIESYVERSSGDTQGLIKVAWDRMLVGVTSGQPENVGFGKEPDPRGESDIEQFAAGLAEEFRSDLGSEEEPTLSAGDVEQIAQRISGTIQAQARVNRADRSSISAQVDEWLYTLTTLSPGAYELVRFLGAFGHLNRSQYISFTADPEFGKIMNELRGQGIISPLKGRKVALAEQPVYWFSPGVVDNLRVAFELSDRDNREERDRLRTKLTSIGYIDDSSEPGRRGWNANRLASDRKLLTGGSTSN
jgi:hypothetical protein